MPQCCLVPHIGDPPTCPMNGQITKPVGRKTVESLIKLEFMKTLTPQPYYFCDAPNCDTVYVSTLGDHLITKDMLTVRVGIKETEDPIPLCYCFGYDRKAVRDDIRLKADTDIQKIITQRVKAGECRCEETNPSGGCCLGEVARAIKQARAMKE
ncbi:MAG: putative iron-sulfur cluster-binding metallochaperone [bacterium]